MYEEEVQRGMDWLAEEHPTVNLGNVNLGSLRMSSFAYCVLGQLFGYGYSVNISSGREGWAVLHGFTLAWDEDACYDSRGEQWQALTDAWKSAIVRAREAAPESGAES